MNVIVSFRHFATPYGYSDAMWAKYPQFAALLKVEDPTTKKPADPQHPASRRHRGATGREHPCASRPRRALLRLRRSDRIHRQDSGGQNGRSQSDRGRAREQPGAKRTHGSRRRRRRSTSSEGRLRVYVRRIGIQGAKPDRAPSITQFRRRRFEGRRPGRGRPSSSYPIGGRGRTLGFAKATLSADGSPRTAAGDVRRRVHSRARARGRRHVACVRRA